MTRLQGTFYVMGSFNAGMALASSLIYYGVDKPQAALPSIAIAVGTTALVCATFYIFVKLARDFPKWNSQ